MTDNTLHSVVASSVITPSGVPRRRQNKCGNDYIEVPRGCTETPDQYSISVISPRITISRGAARWLEGPSLLVETENRLIRESN